MHDRTIQLNWRHGGSLLMQLLLVELVLHTHGIAIPCAFTSTFLIDMFTNIYGWHLIIFIHFSCVLPSNVLWVRREKFCFFRDTKMNLGKYMYMCQCASGLHSAKCLQSFCAAVAVWRHGTGVGVVVVVGGGVVVVVGVGVVVVVGGGVVVVVSADTENAKNRKDECRNQLLRRNFKRHKSIER